MDVQRISIRSGWLPRWLRLLSTGGLIAALLATGGAPAVRAEGGDMGDGLSLCTILPTAVASGTGTLTNPNGSLSLSAGGKVSYKLGQGGIATGVTGNWHVQFTNVSNTSLNGAVFDVTSFTSLAFCKVTDEGLPLPEGATFLADGILNGASGHSIRAQFIDRGSGRNDSLQLQLFDVPVSFQAGATPIYRSVVDFPALPTPTNRPSQGNYQVQTSGKP